MGGGMVGRGCLDRYPGTVPNPFPGWGGKAMSPNLEKRISSSVLGCGEGGFDARGDVYQTGLAGMGTAENLWGPPPFVPLPARRAGDNRAFWFAFPAWFLLSGSVSLSALVYNSIPCSYVCARTQYSCPENHFKGGGKEDATARTVNPNPWG